MKLAVAFSILAFAIGFSSSAIGQGDHAVSLPSGPSQNATGIGTTSKNASSAAPSTAPDESNTNEDDDTLYRGKTSESENPMMRDEGRLHFKTRRKEKIQEVDSLKSLQSSGTNPKFQGSLLNSDVASIEKFSAAQNEAGEAEDQRFKTKRLTFTPDNKDEAKKTESDSTATPTPSPTASPAKKDSGEPKQ